MVKHLFLLAIPLAMTAQQQPTSMTADARSAGLAIRTAIVKAAEKLPDPDYIFRPIATIRAYGEIIGHITDAHYAFCAPLHNTPKAAPGAEKNLHTKAELVAALKESVAYCDAASAEVTDATAAQTVKLFGTDRAKLSVMHMGIAHDNDIMEILWSTFAHAESFLPQANSALPIQQVRPESYTISAMAKEPQSPIRQTLPPGSLRHCNQQSTPSRRTC